MENKGRTGKGRRLSALFVLLRGNIRLETSGWLPSGHTRWQTTLLWCLDPWVLSCCLPSYLILMISTTGTEKEIHLHILSQTLWYRCVFPWESPQTHTRCWLLHSWFIWNKQKNWVAKYRNVKSTQDKTVTGSKTNPRYSISILYYII